MLRVAVDGTSQKISVGDWTRNVTCSPNANGQTVCSTEGSIPLVGASIITNADNGILLAWPKSTSFTSNDTVTQLTPISASGAGTTTSVTGVLQPVLQNQDGSFVGTLDDTQQSLSQMISFDQAGNVRWSATGDYQPQIATADGGVIAQNLDTGIHVTFDTNGSATGQLASLPVQSWTGKAYQVGSVIQVVSNLINFAGSFWPSLGANVSANSTAVIEQTLYVRNFAPWSAFGPDPYAFTDGFIPVTNPCLIDCFVGDNRDFTTSTGEGVTSRINGTVQFLSPGAVPVTSNAYANLTTAVYRTTGLNTGTAKPTISTTFVGNGSAHLHLAGSNPLVVPSPDIDTDLDVVLTEQSGQVCYSGHLYGDAFPNTEVFVINSKGQRTTILNFATTFDRNLGPDLLLGNNNRDMGSFSNVCVPK